MRESPVGILEECADWLESEAQGYRNRALHALKTGQKGSADALLEEADRFQKYSLAVRQQHHGAPQITREELCHARSKHIHHA